MVKRFFIFAPALTAALLLVAVLIAEGGEQDPGWSVSILARTITIACLIASAVAAIAPKRGDVRINATVALAIFAVTAIGQSRMNDLPAIVYRAGCVAFGFVVVATLRAPHRWARAQAAQRPIPTRGRGRPTVVLAMAWLAVAALLVTQLPRASRVVERRVARYFAGYEATEDTVGFSSDLQLGSTRGMLKSAEVVMRADGDRVDYLRGAVLDDYDPRRQHWSSSFDEHRTDVFATADQEKPTTRLRMARSAPVAQGTEARWFLPAGACDLRTESGHVKIDRSGIAHPDPPTLAHKISFRSGASCGEGATARGLPAPPPPGPLDLALAPALRAQLDPIASEWTRGRGNDRAKLDAITMQLTRFGYSLEVSRDRSVDAIVDFLTLHREGHCELFASALALLGRTQGIPTRLVAGYRVTEENPVTGLMVVRERNAHTWVEAWVDGRWQTWDPTPMVELTERTRASRWEQVSEVLAWCWDRVVTAFWHIRLVHVGVAAGVLAVVLLVVRRFTQRGAQRAALDHVVAAHTLPAFDALVHALERAGWIRTASEPLERFAKRVDTGGESWSAEAAQALVGYARLRYGGIGEEPDVAQHLDDVARTIPPRV